MSNFRNSPSLDKGDQDFVDLCDSSDEDDSDEELEIYEEVEDEEFKESKCKCPMCGCMNTIYTRWEGFTPETTIEKAMFNHINNIN
jgi:hypothetical protein